MIQVGYVEGSQTWDTKASRARELFLSMMPTRWKVQRVRVRRDGQRLWASEYAVEEELVRMELETRFPPDARWTK